MPGLAADNTDRVTDSHREASPPSLSPHEADIVALEDQLEHTKITRKGVPYPKVAPSSPKMLAPGSASRPTFTPLRPALQSLQTHQKKGEMLT